MKITVHPFDAPLCVFSCPSGEFENTVSQEMNSTIRFLSDAVFLPHMKHFYMIASDSEIIINFLLSIQIPYIELTST
jgi:hypothetical protein